MIDFLIAFVAISINLAPAAPAPKLIEQDDAIRVTGSSGVKVDFKGELFYIETPAVLPYKSVWDL